MASPTSMWALRLFLLGTVAVWFFTVLYVDPEQGGLLAQGLFYGSLFLWLSSMVTLGLWEIARLLRQDEGIRVWPLLRMGCLAGAIGTVLLRLQQGRLLTWWDGALVIAAGLLLELGWREKTRQKVSESSHPKIV